MWPESNEAGGGGEGKRRAVFIAYNRSLKFLPRSRTWSAAYRQLKDMSQI
jgi:hypothetical protein